ncbi:transposase [Aeromonas veronii]|uniref:transposase n=1 Tax=Aeromonas veronii TaxID=654 RepID=UPI003BA37D46
MFNSSGVPLRLEFAGAPYHITSRGNARDAIYLEESDFALFIEVLDAVCMQFNRVVHAYCLMDNHYYLLLEKPDGNLSKDMRQLNGVFTQTMNIKHHTVGHMFQERDKSILVDKKSCLLELSRYIVLNQVRAKMVDTPDVGLPRMPCCDVLVVPSLFISSLCKRGGIRFGMSLNIRFF